MGKDQLVRPFVKWAGGKKQLLPEIRNKISEAGYFNTYYEPFLGGGAVLLDLQPCKAIVNDYNAELINAYKVIQNNVDELIITLKGFKNDKAFFYEIRRMDREESYSSKSDVYKAARMIYLNKTCFNGLYRVNQQGFFNSPYGYYKNPNYINEQVLRSLHTYFNENDIIFECGDFQDSLKNIEEDSLVYFDPPYAPLSETSNFTGYTSNGFGENEQARLAQVCQQLDNKNVKFIVSNSNVPLIQKIYRDFDISVVLAKRNINSNGKKRGNVEEVLISNF